MVVVSLVEDGRAKKALKSKPSSVCQHVLPPFKYCTCRQIIQYITSPAIQYVELAMNNCDKAKMRMSSWSCTTMLSNAHHQCFVRTIRTNEGTTMLCIHSPTNRDGGGRVSIRYVFMTFAALRRHILSVLKKPIALLSPWLLALLDLALRLLLADPPNTAAAPKRIASHAVLCLHGSRLGHSPSLQTRAPARTIP